MKTIGFILIVAGMAASAVASVPTPEIDANSAYAAVTLLSGALLIVRSRKKK